MLTDEMKANEDFLKRLHRMLFEFEVIEGKLSCPVCTRIYPITNGIPNIMLFDEEA